MSEQVLTYPGDSLLVQAEAASGQHRECLAMCIDAAGKGLSIAGRRRALLLWVNAAERMVAQDPNFETPLGLVRALLDSPLVGAIDFLEEPEDLLQASLAIDLIAAGAIAEQGISNEQASELFAQVEEALPLPACHSMAACLLRGHLPASREHELAVELERAGTSSQFIALATAVKNTTVRQYQLSKLSPNDRARIGSLDELDTEIGELGIYGHRGMGGKLMGALFGNAQEKKALEERSAQYSGAIMNAGGFFGGNPYVKGYRHYLQGRVHAAHDFVDRACNVEFPNAIKAGFDPLTVLNAWVQCLVFLKKFDKARKLIEEWVPQVCSTVPEPGNLIADLYISAGGDPSQLPDPAAAAQHSQAASKNAGDREKSLRMALAAAQQRTKDLLEEFGQKGVTLVDGVVSPQLYDAALTGATSPENVQLEPEAAMRICLDDTPLFKEVGLDGLKGLVGFGLPAHQAGSYSLELIAAFEKRRKPSWRSLAESCPNVFRSQRFLQQRFDEAVEANARKRAIELLIYGRAEDVFSEGEAHKLYETFAQQLEDYGDEEALSTLGEGLLKHLSGDARDDVRDRTKAALLRQSEGASISGRIALLQRAAKVDPKDASITASLKAARSTRLKRRLAIGVVLLVVASLAVLFAVYGKSLGGG